MAVLFTGWLAEFFFLAIVFFLIYYLYFKVVASQFWKVKNVTHLEPVFVLGNTWRVTFFENFAFITADLYKKWKDRKIVGFWHFTRPLLLINDVDLVRNVLTADFAFFRDRGFDINFENDPLAANLFNLGGATWRNIRVKLTPTFTSGKMKMMFPRMVECGEALQQYLAKVAEAEEVVDMKEVLARFSTDIISSCAFGIETNSIENPDSEFRRYGRKIFEPTFVGILSGVVVNISPKLFNFFKMRFTPRDVTKFFLNAVKETMDVRETNNVSRNDLMELLIQLKNKGKIEDVDGEIKDESLNHFNPHAPNPLTPSNAKFSFLEAAAQAFVFFAAGFETSSTTLSCALYELALNTDVQDTLQKEIDQILEKNNGKMGYEAVHEAQYLDCVVQEALRKYPPVPVLFRKCNKDYDVPGMKVTIPNETVVLIPVLAIHMDPDFFPNPERFDPNRFSPEERQKRHQYAFLPFGEGPRICIGNRFGLMQMKIGLISVLSKFRVEVAKDTPIPIKFDKRSFVLATEGGVPLKIVSRR